MGKSFTYETEVDVDLDDILSELDDKDKQELVDELYDEGYVPSQIDSESDSYNYNGIIGEKLYDALTKLRNNRSQLSNEDEEMIINLAEKLV